MCVFVPQDPEKGEMASPQQTSPAKGLQYGNGGCSTKRSPYSTVSSRKVPCCEDFRHLSSESPILTRPSRSALFPLCPTPQIQSHVVAVWAPRALFFSCVRRSPPSSCRSANKSCQTYR